MEKQDIALRILFLRHGEKVITPETPDTALTEKGREESKRKGAELKKSDEIRMYTGDEKRRIETGTLILENSPIFVKTAKGLRDELGFPYSRRFFEEVRARSSDIERAKFYLGFLDQDPDSETKSPKRIACEIQELVKEFKKQMASGSEIVIVNITSDFNISAYLFYALGIKVAIDYLEGFEILVKIDGETTLIFRKQEH